MTHIAIVRNALGTEIPPSVRPTHSIRVPSFHWDLQIVKDLAENAEKKRIKKGGNLRKKIRGIHEAQGIREG